MADGAPRLDVLARRTARPRRRTVPGTAALLDRGMPGRPVDALREGASNEKVVTVQ